MEEVNTLIDKKLYAATDFAYRCGLIQLNKKKSTRSIKVPECCSHIFITSRYHQSFILNISKINAAD